MQLSCGFAGACFSHKVSECNIREKRLSIWPTVIAVLLSSIASQINFKSTIPVMSQFSSKVCTRAGSTCKLAAFPIVVSAKESNLTLFHLDPDILNFGV